jgi:hypothetical protein
MITAASAAPFRRFFRKSPTTPSTIAGSSSSQANPAVSSSAAKMNPTIAKPSAT